MQYVNVMGYWTPQYTDAEKAEIKAAEAASTYSTSPTARMTGATRARYETIMGFDGFDPDKNHNLQAEIDRNYNVAPNREPPAAGSLYPTLTRSTTPPEANPPPVTPPVTPPPPPPPTYPPPPNDDPPPWWPPVGGGGGGYNQPPTQGKGGNQQPGGAADMYGFNPRLSVGQHGFGNQPNFGQTYGYPGFLPPVTYPDTPPQNPNLIPQSAPAMTEQQYMALIKGTT